MLHHLKMWSAAAASVAENWAGLNFLRQRRLRFFLCQLGQNHHSKNGKGRIENEGEQLHLRNSSRFGLNRMSPPLTLNSEAWEGLQFSNTEGCVTDRSCLNCSLMAAALQLLGLSWSREMKSVCEVCNKKKPKYVKLIVAIKSRPQR